MQSVICLETEVNKTQVYEELVIAVFFDVEKGSDVGWKGDFPVGLTGCDQILVIDTPYTFYTLSFQCFQKNLRKGSSVSFNVFLSNMSQFLYDNLSK